MTPCNRRVAPNKPAIQKKDTTTKLEAVPAPTHGGRMVWSKNKTSVSLVFGFRGKIHPPKNTHTLSGFSLNGFFVCWVYGLGSPKTMGKFTPSQKRCFRSHLQTQVESGHPTFPPPDEDPAARLTLAAGRFGWIFVLLSFGCFRKKKSKHPLIYSNLLLRA